LIPYLIPHVSRCVVVWTAGAVNAKLEAAEYQIEKLEKEKEKLKNALKVCVT
jgi:hypothetical protein